MKLLLSILAFILTHSFTLFVVGATPTPAFISSAKKDSSTLLTSGAIMNDDDKSQTPCHASPHPFTMLPGDPSLILTTNVDLGDKKLEIMKGKYIVETNHSSICQVLIQVLGWIP